MALLAGACAPAASATVPKTDPSPERLASTGIPQPTPLAELTTKAPVCSEAHGSLETRVIQQTKPPQEIVVYTPPCYASFTDRRFPVLYLLHGQTYTDRQWLDLGVSVVADDLINNQSAPPFIIVLPDDRYWNVESGLGFGDRFINNVIPYVDDNYRTLADRSHRALGGMSRGGGWAIRFLFTRHDLFGSVGLHSAVLFAEEHANKDSLIASVSRADWPRIWMDIGEQDTGLGELRNLAGELARSEVSFEWHVYPGAHTNEYWSSHLREYLQWYTSAWK